MANEIRLRQGFLGGLVEDNPLSAVATVLNSASLAAMVAVTATGHLPIVLDPDGYEGDPEIAYVTSHAASASTCTLLRAQEGTLARQHNKNTPWRHGPLTTDLQPGSENVYVANSGAALTLPDWTTAAFHRITLTANTTLTLPAPAPGRSLTVVVAQDATGARTLAWATPSGTIKWSAAVTPTVTPTASKEDVYTFLASTTTAWLGFTAGQNF